uniref:Uncharacterized protein n=2 Tax=Meloidogyne TaxID=189290 RepID=A0A915P892_9BILA
MFNRQILFLILILVLVSDTCAFWFPWYEKSSSSSSEERHGWGHHRWGPFGRGRGGRHHHKHKQTSTSFPATTGTVSPPSTTT